MHLALFVNLLVLSQLLHLSRALSTPPPIDSLTAETAWLVIDASKNVTLQHDLKSQLMYLKARIELMKPDDKLNLKDRTLIDGLLKYNLPALQRQNRSILYERMYTNVKRMLTGTQKTAVSHAEAAFREYSTAKNPDIALERLKREISYLPRVDEIKADPDADWVAVVLARRTQDVQHPYGTPPPGKWCKWCKHLKNPKVYVPAGIGILSAGAAVVYRKEIGDFIKSWSKEETAFPDIPADSKEPSIASTNPSRTQPPSKSPNLTMIIIIVVVVTLLVLVGIAYSVWKLGYLKLPINFAAALRTIYKRQSQRSLTSSPTPTLDGTSPAALKA